MLSRAVTILAILLAPLILPAADHHVDCTAGNDQAAGTQASTAWGSLAQVNATTFSPGDRIYLKRGTTCKGQLWPKGSGKVGRPVTLGAYGQGSLPVIQASGMESGVRLFNQQHWVIQNIEVTGSSEYGIHISGDQGVLRDITIRDSVVHDVNSAEKMKTKRSGLIVVEAGHDQVFEGILIDGVTAYKTNRWAGIIVSGGQFKMDVELPRSRNVIVRNSIVRQVYGDGIVLFSVHDGIIERSAAWHTGLEPRRTIGTPNGIWTWTCDNCIIRENESYFSDSPGIDGGAFDIDWGNGRNLAENNYGHEAQSYCIAIFGAARLVTTQTEIRGNVCAGNGRSARLALHHGGVHLATWDKGFIDGVHIHHNVFLWEPALRAPLLLVEADFSGTLPNVFEHNQIAPKDVQVEKQLSQNVRVAGNSLHNRADLLALPPASPAPPELRNMNVASDKRRDSPALISFLAKACKDCRSQAVVMESAAAQYATKGLKSVIVTADPGAIRNDWHIRSASVQSGAMPQAKLPLTFLLDASGRLLHRWEGFAPSKDVVFAVRKLLGPPAGAGDR